MRHIVRCAIGHSRCGRLLAAHRPADVQARATSSPRTPPLAPQDAVTVAAVLSATIKAPLRRWHYLRARASRRFAIFHRLASLSRGFGSNASTSGEGCLMVGASYRRRAGPFRLLHSNRRVCRISAPFRLTPRTPVPSIRRRSADNPIASFLVPAEEPAPEGLVEGLDDRADAGTSTVSPPIADASAIGSSA